MVTGNSGRGQNELAYHGRDGDRGGDRNQAAGAPLEQKSSTASRIDASGALKIAAIPPAAPETEQDFAFVGGQVQVLGESEPSTRRSR